MITRIFFFLFGFSLMIIGFMYIIIYINLLSFGYTVGEYLVYVVSHYECLLSLVGFIIVLFCLFRKGKKHDKCI